MSDYSAQIKSHLPQQLGDNSEFKGYFEAFITTQREYDKLQKGYWSILSIIVSTHFNQIENILYDFMGYRKQGWIIVSSQGLHFVKTKVRKRKNEVDIEYKEHMTFLFSELSYIHGQDKMTEVDLVFSHKGERYLVKLESRFFIYRQLLPFINGVLNNNLEQKL